ncbi:MAG: bifunctional DNA primase/polymerase [Actinomycetota bacterium]|nr:bifunctional DNA primase/polymerase [Actinomycetota bacterium]
MDDAIEQAALGYAARGWSVIPAQPQAKRPIVRWKPFQREAADADTIRAWWKRWPDANVSIVTGEVSGLIVVDVDPRHGGDRSLAALVKRHTRLPDTVESRTGGGGRHLYFAHPGGELHNRAGFEPGLDVRGDGGCVVAPPSIHPSGKRYAWRKGHGPDDLEPVAAPEWLLEIVRDGGEA